MYTLILAFKPSGQRTPYIVDTGDSPGAEEVLLHKTDRVFYGPLALRIRFIAYPKSELLFSTEILEYSGFDDFSIGFAGYEHSILIDNKYGRAAAKLTE